MCSNIVNLCATSTRRKGQRVTAAPEGGGSLMWEHIVCPHIHTRARLSLWRTFFSVNLWHFLCQHSLGVCVCVCLTWGLSRLIYSCTWLFDLEHLTGTFVYSSLSHAYISCCQYIFAQTSMWHILTLPPVSSRKETSNNNNHTTRSLLLPSQQMNPESVQLQHTNCSRRGWRRRKGRRRRRTPNSNECELNLSLLSSIYCTIAFEWHTSPIIMSWDSSSIVRASPREYSKCVHRWWWWWPSCVQSNQRQYFFLSFSLF